VGRDNVVGIASIATGWTIRGSIPGRGEVSAPLNTGPGGLLTVGTGSLSGW
jgi:hypothetical protein